MTEQEWLVSKDPEAMLKRLGHPHAKGYSRRKGRLWVCACVRLVWEKLDDPRSRRAVEEAEKLADNPSYQVPDEVRRDAGAADNERHAFVHPYWLAQAVVTDYRSGSSFPESTAVIRTRTEPPEAQGKDYAALLREVFGNPYSPPLGHRLYQTGDKDAPDSIRDSNGEVVLALCRSCGKGEVDLLGRPCKTVAIWLAWHNGIVRQLAKAAYSQRLPDGRLDTQRLAVLADALEEAGCNREDLLQHLRSPGPHFRGCWVLDLLLGKE